jgi:Peroxide stress protein YaaA
MAPTPADAVATVALMGPPLVLLPPSEGKSPGGRRGNARDRFAPELREPRTTVLEALTKVLATASESEKSKILRVRGELLERAVVATQRLIDDAAPLLPAWKRYSGVVWEALDPSTLAPAVRARILVPSALYGITSAQDYIADYRLGMQSSLPGVGNLARFWRPLLTDLIRPSRRGTMVIDLLTADLGRARRLCRSTGPRCGRSRRKGCEGPLRPPCDRPRHRRSALVYARRMEGAAHGHRIPGPCPEVIPTDVERPVNWVDLGLLLGAPNETFIAVLTFGRRRVSSSG